MVDYVKPVAKKKSEILLIHIRTNDLRKSVNTTRKVRKYVEVIQELNNAEKIWIGYYRTIQRSHKDFSNEITKNNIKLKNYYLGKGFSFVDNYNLN